MLGLATIHPTAVVDPLAQLAEDVVVGPGCMVTGRVTLGAGCRLVANVMLNGPMTMGKNNRVYPFVCLGYAPQDSGYDPKHDGAGLVIGDDNVFREYVTIHRATGDRPTAVGDRNLWMVNSHAGHDTVVGNDCTLSNGVLLAGHVTLGDHVILGGISGIHQFCRVGRMTMISGMGSTTKDVPPFCTLRHRDAVSSLNVIGLRRHDLREHIKPLQKAFDIVFKQSHINAVKVELIEQQLGDDPLCMEMADFIRASTRGVCGYLRS